MEGALDKYFNLMKTKASANFQFSYLKNPPVSQVLRKKCVLIYKKLSNLFYLRSTSINSTLSNPS